MRPHAAGTAEGMNQEGSLMRAQRIPGRTAGMLIGRSNGSVGGSKGIAHSVDSARHRVGLSAVKAGVWRDQGQRSPVS